VIITLPKLPAAGVYIVVQLPNDNVQEDGLNVPPLFPSLHDTVPAGIIELELPAIFTVNVACDP